MNTTELRVEFLLKKVKNAIDTLNTCIKKLSKEDIIWNINYEPRDLLDCKSNLNLKLSEALSKSVNDLNGTKQELITVSQVLKSDVISDNNRDFVEDIIEDAIEDGLKTVEHSKGLLETYAVYRSACSSINASGFFGWKA